MPTPLQSFLSTALGPLPEPAQAMLGSSRPMSAGAGEPLLRAGDRWSSLFWVETGELRFH